MGNLQTFRTVPPDSFPELAVLLERIRRTYPPKGVLLYGSRARGTATPDSDWDLKVIVDDAAPDWLMSPLFGWNVQEGSGVYADVSYARESEFHADLDVPNSAAFDIARHCFRIDVNDLHVGNDLPPLAADLSAEEVRR